MKEQNTLVKYTRSEIDTLPDETDWERVDALTDEDIDAAASSDPDAPPTDASFWKDATVVMPENMEEYTQRQIMGIINKIVEKSRDGSYIYRGEPKCYPKVSSSLWRLLQLGDGISMTIPDITPVREMFLEDARRYARDIDVDDFDLEAQLQHNGGKTSLIDFTTDYLIALFFACDGKPTQDGRVILLKQDETTKDWIKKPKNPEHRVIAQKSIFVQPPGGFIERCKYDKPIKIRKDLKKTMLDYLRKHHGIFPESIYNDLQGFIKHQGIHQRAYIDFYIGLSHVFLGEFDHAITAFTKAMDLSPNFAAAYNNLGMVYGKKSDYAQAIEMLDKAIELNPNYADAYSNRGIVSSLKGDYAHAIEMLDKAIELNPNHADAYSNRGIANLKRGNYISAIVDLDKAIELNPNHADAYNNRGVIYNNKGEVDLAIADCTKAIELNPNHADAYYNRSLAYHKKGEFARAIKDCERTIELNPNHADAYNSRGVIYNNKGEVDLAIADCTKAIELNPNHADAYYNRSLAYHKKGEFARAIKDCERTIELNPNHADAYNSRGIAYRQIGKLTRAIADFDRSIELNPNDASAYNNRGGSYYDKGNYDCAIKDFNRAIELNPNFAEVYNHRAAAQRELENLDKQ